MAYLRQTDELTIIKEGTITICLENRTVEVCNKETTLTKKEFEILALLMANPKRVFTYDKIVEIIWHENPDYYSRKAINNHISNIRNKIKKVAPECDCIESVHGIGYRFFWKYQEE